VSLDGKVGGIRDIYFDDLHWAIRYLVISTGTRLKGRQVLISPLALLGVNRSGSEIKVNLEMAEIEGGPTLEEHEPVSIQFERDYYGHYAWPPYWVGPNMWGLSPFIMRTPAVYTDSAPLDTHADRHLRSLQEVLGYKIAVLDGEIGHVADFLVDDKVWAMRYIVVEQRSWLHWRRFLLPIDKVDRVIWEDSKVSVKLTRDQVKDSPDFVDAALSDHEFEASLQQYYEKPLV
jgi:uncharacterized protein YrrD